MQRDKTKAAEAGVLMGFVEKAKAKRIIGTEKRIGNSQRRKSQSQEFRRGDSADRTVLRLVNAITY